METLTIELINPKAMSLLEELEELHLIKVLKKEPVQKAKLSAMLRGSISPQASEEFNESVKKSREEWQRPIS